jgi:hypothetical protein
MMVIESIGRMVVEVPEMLGLFGVAGFEVDEEADEAYYD